MKKAQLNSKKTYFLIPLFLLCLALFYLVFIPSKNEESGLIKRSFKGLAFQFKKVFTGGQTMSQQSAQATQQIPEENFLLEINEQNFSEDVRQFTHNWQTRYPDWKVDSFEDMRFQSVSGPQIAFDQGQGDIQNLREFLKKHPELVAGIPLGSQLYYQESLHEGAQSSISLQARYKNMEMPGNLVFFKNQDGSIDRINNSIPKLKTIRECATISEAQAQAVLLTKIPRKIIFPPEQEKRLKPELILRGAGDEQGIPVWHLFFYFEKKLGPAENEKSPLYHAWIDACSAQLIKPPQLIIQQEEPKGWL